jgi:hypothetical protein
MSDERDKLTKTDESESEDNDVEAHSWGGKDTERERHGGKDTEREHHGGKDS